MASAIASACRRARSTWLTHLASSHGKLVLDDGAVTAVVDNHRSLLPAGVDGVLVAGRALSATHEAQAQPVIPRDGFLPPDDHIQQVASDVA